MNPSPTTEQKIVKTTHNPVSENPKANYNGGGDIGAITATCWGRPTPQRNKVSAYS